LLDARSETRRWDATRALTGAHAPWSFAARGISNTAPTRGGDDKDAPAVTSPSGDATNNVQATAQDSADKAGRLRPCLCVCALAVERQVALVWMVD